MSLSSTRRKKSQQSDGYVGILAADIHFPENGSLKDKRQYLRSIKAGLARRFGASVSETGFHDLWQRSRLVLSLCSPTAGELEKSLDKAVFFLEEKDLHLRIAHREIIRIEGEE